jgi:hypothetical protein
MFVDSSNEEPSMGRILRLGFAWIGFLFFPGVLFLETIELLQLRATTDAVISEVHFRPGTRSKNRNGIGRVDVAFSYEVGSRTYESRQKMAGWMHRYFVSSGRGHWYQKGQRIPVHYNPNRPRQAALERGWFLWTWIFTALFSAYPATLWASHRAVRPVRRFLLHVAGRSILYLAILAYFLAPEAMLPKYLPWMAVGWAGLFGMQATYEWFAHRNIWFEDATTQDQTLP